MRRLLVPAVALLALALPAGASAGGNVRAGAAVLDGTYHVGNSAGQYASTRDGGYGDVDPHLQSVKNQAAYGVESRESVRALVIRGGDGQYAALVSNDHYIPQDALWRRTAQLLEADTNGQINEHNLTLSVMHNHSSPSYSSLDWGVWSFQDVFDFRFFDYYAHQNAKAVEQALAHMHNVRVSATVSRFDAFQKNPMGPTWGDDGTPAGFPRPHTDHDLSVVHFENIDDPARPQALSTLVNIGQHPEDLEGYDLISGEFPQVTERFVDRTVGGVTILTQNATGTSEVEEDRWHPIHAREMFNHAQYGQMEWAARQLADGIIGDVNDIRAQRPSAAVSRTPYGGTSYHDRFVPWMSRFPVAMDDRWFPGPVSHPVPGVSSCRTDAAFQGDPRLPVVGLPDCQDVPLSSSLSPVTALGGQSPGLSTDTFEALGIPIPENYSFPSTGALEDTYGVHMQALRLGDILFTICSCEQWVEQSYNIKTRADTVPGNEYLGYDPTAPNANPDEKCTKDGDGTYSDDGSGTGHWTCTLRDEPGGSISRKFDDRPIEHMRAQILGNAAGWDDPRCKELGCGVQAESEPTDLLKVFGNYTHDDTGVRGGNVQSAAYARRRGYRLVFTIGMANDYNGYIASYREYSDRDHYRKALTGWGPHSSDYYATRLVEMGHALKGDAEAARDVAGQTDLAQADPAWAPMIAKEQADQHQEEAKVEAVGRAASAGVAAYAKTIPDDGGTNDELVQPKDIQRFDAATFTWDGGNNYTDNPEVVVQREVGGHWVDFADQSGEVPVVVHYPAGQAGLDQNTPGQLANGIVAYRAGGQVWKWTATFEAFDSRFPLVDPQGHSYVATPAGRYRFVVQGQWHRNGADAPYSRVSREFTVAPWDGITVDDAHVDGAGHVTFAAGPAHDVKEQTVRHTARPPFNSDDSPYPFRIGPVDFPDMAKDPAATGARFLSPTRGYSGSSPDDVEQYCLDCSFRPWLDASDRDPAHPGTADPMPLTATVTFHRPGADPTELVTSTDGTFTTRRRLGPNETADIVIRDPYGDLSGTPGRVG